MKSSNVSNKKFLVFGHFFSGKCYVVERKKNNVETGCFIITGPPKQSTDDFYTEENFRNVPK